MKLSNKILVGFLAFIFLYLTAAFTELRITGSPNVIDNKNSIAETVDLPAEITRLVIQNMDSRKVEVIGSDRAQLEVRSFKGGELRKLKYQIAGDALIISGFGGENERLRISLFVPNERLKQIRITSGVVTIKDLNQETLHLSQDGANLWMFTSNIGKVQTDLSNKSFLQIETTKLDTVSADIEQSQLYISTSVELLMGTIKNNSMVHLNEIREIQLKKDSTSKFQIY